MVSRMSNTIVRYGNAKAECTPAAGVRGVLCRRLNGDYFFRVYAEDHSFIDYELRHDDLEVTITEGALASFYRIGNDYILDHSPEVLGKSAENENQGHL